MSHHESGTNMVYLKAGEMVIADHPCLVSTLLGSCVAITLFSPRRKSGAICHALLPSCAGPGHGDCPERFRHVECAVHAMLEAFCKRGIPSDGVEAKVFGGADMFRTDGGRDDRLAVGRQNVEKAWEVLRCEGVRIAAYDVGGVQGRKIIFAAHTGEVFLKRLNGMERDNDMPRAATGEVR